MASGRRTTATEFGEEMTRVADDLKGLRVAFLVANEGIEQVELTKPWDAVTYAGGRPELIAPEPGKAQAVNHLEPGDSFNVDHTTAELDVDAYDAVVLPGGVANPDQLRTDDEAVAFVRAMVDAGKPVAAICHGPWTLIESDVVRDRTLTSWPSLHTDVTNAGGHWVDQEVVVCKSDQTPNTLITSRKPDDLPAFCRTLVDELAKETAGSPR
jgi:protease I